VISTLFAGDLRHPVQSAKKMVNQVRLSIAAIVLLVAGLPASAVNAQDLSEEVVELRQMIVEMRENYEHRISDLEQRLDKAERDASGARREAGEAIELAEQTAIEQSSGSSAPNTFNPSIGSVITGHFADVGPGWQEIPGFQPAGEIGTSGSGFSVGEADINIKANVDGSYFGNLTLALAEENGEVAVEFEEAWFQTTALPLGLSVTGGRFFSAAGYLNSFHFHTDDFVDRPLPYQAFFGGRYAVDGVQARWVAPTSLLVEVGTELNWGGSFPATANDETSPGAWTLFTKFGGDIGDSHSWQLGLSHINADTKDRAGVETDPATFTGDSDLTAIDFVWKWAPQGNPTIRNLKFQGEYFRRDEDGLFDGLTYVGEQTGWYLQSVWQFAQLWRVGLRHDVVDADNGSSVDGTQLEDPGRSSRRSSLMLDWSPSEFSRLRLQYTNDQVLPGSEDQWYLQYIMSIGSHGAHQF
jgi:hypothetical protein